MEAGRKIIADIPLSYKKAESLILGPLISRKKIRENVTKMRKMGDLRIDGKSVAC